MYAMGTMRNTGSPSGDRGVDQRSTGNSRETGRAVWDGGEARTTDEAGELRWRKGASVERKRKKRQRTEGLAMSLTNPLSGQKLQAAAHGQTKGSAQLR